MLKLVIGLGIIIAAWVGGASFGQIFSLGFAGIAVLLFVLTLVSMRVFMWANFPIISWLIYCIMLFFAFGAGSASKYALSDMPTFTQGSEAPIGIELVKHFGKNTGNVRITNNGSDMLVEAKVRCNLFYDNGKQVNHDFINGIGGPEQYAPGASKVTMVIADTKFEIYDADASTMQCSVYSAEFAKRPAFMNQLDVKWATNAKYSTDFFVTNNSTVPVKKIQFNCVNTKGESQQVQAYPAYLTDLHKDTIVGVNETQKYVSSDKHFTYTSCVVSNAVAG